MATHSSNLAWRIPWTEEPGGATVYGVTKSRTRLKRLSTTLRVRKSADIVQGLWRAETESLTGVGSGE